MQEITIFSHEMFGKIRTMTNEKGETFFVGKDVCDALQAKELDMAVHNLTRLLIERRVIHRLCHTEEIVIPFLLGVDVNIEEE